MSQNSEMIASWLIFDSIFFHFRMVLFPNYTNVLSIMFIANNYFPFPTVLKIAIEMNEKKKVFA